MVRNSPGFPPPPNPHRHDPDIHSAMEDSVELNVKAPSQALRYNAEKARLSLVLDAPAALHGVTRVLEYGCDKYSRGNFKAGMPFTEVMDSLLRHLTSFASGEDRDPESGLPHVDHVLCNAVFLSEFYYTRREFDDRVGVE